MEVLTLDPAKVLADDNIRFGLKKLHVESLKASIVEHGGVLVPVSVEALKDADKNGHTHRLIAGFYRHEAVTQLNKEGAGITLPAVEASPDDALDRLKQQLAENKERENMSPMDEATAIKALLDAGVSKQEVRNIFARPKGKKNLTLQMASNSWVNIMLNLLELPKSVQEKIHNGYVSLAAAYELGKASPDKRTAILEAAESARVKAEASEEADEAKFLESQKKLQVVTDEAAALATAAQEAEAAIEVAKQAAVDARAAEDAAKALVGIAEMTPAEKRAATDKVKAALAATKQADKAVKDALNLHSKAVTAAADAREKAEAEAAKVEAKLKLKAKTKKKAAPVTQAEVKKAAATVTEGENYVPLNIAQVRAALKEAIAQKSYPKAGAILEAVKKCVDGISTPKEMAFDIAVLIGEAKGK